MLGDERLGRRAARDHVRHRRLYLQEAEAVEEAADVVDDFGAGDEDAARVLGEDEVEVALAVAGLLVLQTEVRRGKLVEVGCQEDHLRGRNGQLALLGARGGSDDADNVAATEVFVGRGKFIRVFCISGGRREEGGFGCYTLS